MKTLKMAFSQWSTRAKANPGTITFDADDVPIAQEIISDMLNKIGSNPRLRGELSSLTSDKGKGWIVRNGCLSIPAWRTSWPNKKPCGRIWNFSRCQL